MIAYITVGVSGSGKSTLAAQMLEEGSVDFIIERDQVRRQLFNFGQWYEYKFTKAKERMVTEVIDDLIQEASRSGKNIIISDTNLNTSFRNQLTTKLIDLGYEPSLVPCPVTYEEACNNDLKRAYSVGSEVIAKQWKQWIEFSRSYLSTYKYEPNPTLKPAYIFDIDGTIATNSGERGWYDWKKVGVDKPRIPVVGILKLLQSSSFSIILLSGRDGCCRKETEQWLIAQGISAPLFMRPESDNSCDTIVKKRLFLKHVAPFYNVVGVFDDRPKVVNMWHDIGIPNVFAVADQRMQF